MAVITNGNVIQQKNKINSINWHGLKSKINFIFANEHAPKPDPSSFNFVKEQINFKMAVYIGDSLSDEEFAIIATLSLLM
ncbi:MAG: HAD hydrolase-like protein [Saprospiraceae bacterium]|nr:HAD hydrolase-like protein [Saprospiraceae bacterium]